MYGAMTSHWQIEWNREECQGKKYSRFKAPKELFICFLIRKIHLSDYSYLSNKRRVANRRRVWKKYINLINEGSGTNEGPGIFVTLYKEAFFRFSPSFSMI